MNGLKFGERSKFLHTALLTCSFNDPFCSKGDFSEEGAGGAGFLERRGMDRGRGMGCVVSQLTSPFINL